MTSAETAAREARIRPFGVFAAAPPLHFWLLQAIAFAYVLYRMASRNYTVYGFLDDSMFDYAKAQTSHLEFWPRPLIHFTGTQFIYAFLPRPTPEVLRWVQYAIIGACSAGLLGLFPRLAAATALLLALHLKGLMVSTNAMTDGGTMALAALFSVMIAPKDAFYRLGRKLDFSRRSADYAWPVFVFWLFMSAFYSYSGLNKLVEIGPHWPFLLHLENLSKLALERSMFWSSRYVDAPLAAMITATWFSHLSGVLTLAGELGFASILFAPRWRFALVISMIVLHHLVLAMQAINFIGTSVLLILCVDWNAPLRRLDILDVGNRFGEGGWVERFRKFDVFKKIRWSPPGEDAPRRRTGMLVVRDETGEEWSGIWALDQMFLRCPLTWPLAAALRFPFLGLAIEKVLARRYRPS